MLSLVRRVSRVEYVERSRYIVLIRAFDVQTVSIRTKDANDMRNIASKHAVCFSTLIFLLAQPITFITLPAHKELSSLDGEVYSFKISQQRDVDDVICYITSTLPEILSFEVRNKSKTGKDHNVYF